MHLRLGTSLCILLNCPAIVYHFFMYNIYCGCISLLKKKKKEMYLWLHFRSEVVKYGYSLITAISIWVWVLLLTRMFVGMCSHESLLSHFLFSFFLFLFLSYGGHRFRASFCHNLRGNGDLPFIFSFFNIFLGGFISIFGSC